MADRTEDGALKNALRELIRLRHAGRFSLTSSVRKPAISSEPIMISMRNTLPCSKKFRKYAINTAGNKLISKGLVI